MNIQKVEFSPETIRVLALVFAAGFVLGLLFGRGIRIMMFNVLVGSNYNRINP